MSSDHDSVLTFANNLRWIGENESLRGRHPREWIDELRSIGFFSFESAFAEIDGAMVCVEYVSRRDVRPREGLRVFRGSSVEARDSIYWEATLDRAILYAGDDPEAVIRHKDPHLFSVVVPPRRILARMAGTEWLVDTHGLTITDHGTVRPARLPRVKVHDLPLGTPNREQLVAAGMGDIAVIREPTTKLHIRDTDEEGA